MTKSYPMKRGRKLLYGALGAAFVGSLSLIPVAQAAEMEMSMSEDAVMTMYVVEECSGQRFSQEEWAEMLDEADAMDVSLSEMEMLRNHVRRKAGIGYCNSEDWMARRETLHQAM